MGIGKEKIIKLREAGVKTYKMNHEKKVNLESSTFRELKVKFNRLDIYTLESLNQRKVTRAMFGDMMTKI